MINDVPGANDMTGSDESSNKPVSQEGCGLDCYVTFYVGAQGNQKRRQLNTFLKHDNLLYKQVFTHVTECDRCCPVSVLETYLQSRLDRFQGVTSSTLVRLVDKYENHYSKIGQPLPPDLIDEFYIRSVNPRILIDRSLTKHQLLRAFKLLRSYHIKTWPSEQRIRSSIFRLALDGKEKLALVRAKKRRPEQVKLIKLFVEYWDLNMEPDEETWELLKVAETMAS